MSANGFYIADSTSWKLAVVNINTCIYCLLVASSRVRCLLDVSDFPLIGMPFFASPSVFSEPHPWPVCGKSGRRSLVKY